MRSNLRRVVLGLFALFASMMTVTALAADVPEDALKAVLESDVKRVNELVEKFNMTPDKKSPIQIRSSAMMIAAYSQSKITGKDAAADQKWAGMRDQALKVYETALGTGKDLKKATPLDLAKMGQGKADLLKLHSAVKFDVNDLMAQFKKTTANGLNLEQDIKDGANKGAKVDSMGIAVRVAFVGDFLKDVGPDGGFAGSKQTKKEWDSTTEKMLSANKELIGAGTDAKKVQAALKKLDGACTACHNVFK